MPRPRPPRSISSLEAPSHCRRPPFRLGARLISHRSAFQQPASTLIATSELPSIPTTR